MALRISRTVFSALSGTRLLACLIVAPQQGYDEPEILSYAIRPFCPTSADGLHAMRLILCTAIGASIGAKNLIPEEVDYTKIAIRVTVMNKV